MQVRKVSGDTGAAGAGAAVGGVGARVEWIVPDRRGGGVPIDVDEALQGLYQVARTVSDAVSKRSPQSPASDGAASGIGGYAFSAAVGIPVAFFSALAIRGGWAEVAEARKHCAVVEARHAQSRAAREAAHQRLIKSGTAVPDSVRSEYLVHAQACEDLEDERSCNRSAAGVGLSACAAGSMMLLRTVSDAALQVGLAIVAKSFNVAGVLASSTIAAALSGAIAMVGTIVLGPLAGVFATTLGAFYLHQSRIRFRRLDTDRTLVRAALERHVGEGAALRRYRDYVLGKVENRHRFLRRFRNWNSAFMIGGLLSAGVAAIKGGIAVAALVGLGAVVLSGPFGLALLVVGTVGALVLGVASVPFITQGAKNKRHRLQYAGDHAQVDRHLVAPLDLLLAGADGAGEGPIASAGLQLRSQLYVSIEQRKKALTDLLAAAAPGPGAAVARDGADGSVPIRRVASLDLRSAGLAGPRLWPHWMACRAFARALAVGQGFGQARLRASTAYRHAMPEAKLAGWLATERGLSAQRAFMLACLTSQQDYLSAKLQTVELACGAVALGDAPPGAAADAAPALRLQMAASSDADRQTLESINALRTEVERMDARNADALTQRFLQLHGVAMEQCAEEGAARHAFCQFCLEDLSPQLAEMAGVLVATELHAARVMKRATTQTISD